MGPVQVSGANTHVVKLFRNSEGHVLSVVFEDARERNVRCDNRPAVETTRMRMWKMQTQRGAGYATNACGVAPKRDWREVTW
jgi:hypothetical protein